MPFGFKHIRENNYEEFPLESVLSLVTQNLSMTNSETSNFTLQILTDNVSIFFVTRLIPTTETILEAYIYAF
jgi:hypothetical protein